MTSQHKLFVASLAVIAMTFCCTSEANGQGLRLGNFVRAGGGQGFRVGGPRVGVHFGGGQGASFGVGRVGMRFGNGQGARFGGLNYGMQFGGQQGTQFGPFRTTPVVDPGSYYYQDVQGLAYGATPYPQTYGTTYAPQGVAFQPAYEAPQTAVAPTDVMQPQASYDIAANLQPSSAEPTIAEPVSTNEPVVTGDSVVAGDVMANEVAANNFPESDSIDETAAIEPIADDPFEPTTIVESTTTSSPTAIRLQLPVEETESISFNANGTNYTLAPGGELILQAEQDWSLKFAAGGEHGERTADLRDAGKFYFSRTDEGLVLLEGEVTNGETTGEVTEAVAEPVEAPIEIETQSELDKDEPAPAEAPESTIEEDGDSEN